MSALKLTIPFKMDDQYGGFAESEGLLVFTGSTLRIELRTKDSLFGIIQSGVKKVELKPADVLKITLKKGLAGSKIVIEPANLNILNRIPGLDKPILKFKIKNKYKNDAISKIPEFNLLISEENLRDIEVHECRLNHVPAALSNKRTGFAL